MKIARVNQITGEFRIGNPEELEPALTGVRIVARRAVIAVEIGGNEIAAAIERGERPMVLLIGEFVARRTPKTSTGEVADFDMAVFHLAADDGTGSSLPSQYVIECADEDVSGLRRQLQADGWQPAE